MWRDLIRCYYANCNSPTAALQAYKKEKQLINNPCNTTSIQRLIYKFETTFTLLDQPGRGRKSLADDGRHQLPLLSNQHHHICQHLLYDGFLMRQIFLFLQYSMKVTRKSACNLEISLGTMNTNSFLFFGAMKRIFIWMVTSVVIIAEFGAEANLMNF